MSKKKYRSFAVRQCRHPQPAWKPFFAGIGDILNVAPKTDYFGQKTTDIGTVWSRVGSYLFHSARSLGTLPEASRHAFDLCVKHGETQTLAHVYEFRPTGNRDYYVAVYERGDDGVEVVGLSQSETEISLDESDGGPAPLTKQINWVEEAQSES